MARLSERLPGLRPSLPWILLALSLTLNVFFLGGYYYKRSLDLRLANEQERSRYIVEKMRFTDEQRQRFQELRLRTRDRARETNRANRPIIDSMWHEIEQPEPNQTQLDGHIDRLTANRLALQREQMHDLVAFAKGLDETQRVEFLELVRTRLERGGIPRRPER